MEYLAHLWAVVWGGVDAEFGRPRHVPELLGVVPPAQRRVGHLQGLVAVLHVEVLLRLRIMHGIGTRTRLYMYQNEDEGKKRSIDLVREYVIDICNIPMRRG